MRKEGNFEIRVLWRILKGVSDQGISPANINIEKLIQLAELHRVSYQLFSYSRAHPGILSDTQSEKLGLLCRQNALRSLDQLRELIRVVKNLQNSGIHCVVIKGPQLARMVYGREALKESVDLDIMLVHESSLDKAHDLLKSLGYSQSNLNSHPGKLSRKIFLVAKREVQFFNPASRINIDLHLRPGSNNYLTAGLFRDFFRETEAYDLEGFSIHILPPEEYLAYLCYHGSLHQFARLAWLMDIRAFIEVKGGSVDYSRLMSLAVAMKTERSVFVTWALLKHFFDDPVPGIIEKAMSQAKRLGFLVKSCEQVLSRESGYDLTLRGKLSKLAYKMVLIRGMAGRVDLLYGIFMRVLTKWI